MDDGDDEETVFVCSDCGEDFDEMGMDGKVCWFCRDRRDLEAEDEDNEEGDD